MNILDKIAILPETISTDEVKFFINHIINSERKFIELNSKRISEALFELSQKQWENYEVLDSITKDYISGFIVNMIKSKPSNEVVDKLFQVINYFGLQNCLEKLKSLNINDISQDLVLIIRNNVDQMPPNIENPYNDFWGN